MFSTRGVFVLRSRSTLLGVSRVRRFGSLSERIPKGYVQPTPKADDLVIIAMSSGVDSSVAASLYSKVYKNCVGIFMENWSQVDNERCLEQDWKDAQTVAKQLDLPIERVNFEKDYWNEVFQPMLDNYSKGLTPNPDINCNKYIKFGSLIDYVSKKYGDKNWWLVTGHYSRILQHKETGEFHLMRSYYKPKDQSYYLSQINPKFLKKILLPIGNYAKPEIREIAKQEELAVAEKKDSQGLCFVSQTQGNFNQFLRNFLEDSPGNIITEDGKVWGNHNGLWTYTLGQRVRISLPQGDPRYQGVWFVSKKNFETGDMTIVRGRDNEELFTQLIYVKDFVQLDEHIDLQDKVPQLSVQYRSLQDPISLKSIDKTSTGLLVFNLDKKSRAISPGQYLTVYDGDRCLGSGVIAATE